MKCELIFEDCFDDMFLQTVLSKYKLSVSMCEGHVSGRVEPKSMKQKQQK